MTDVIRIAATVTGMFVWFVGAIAGLRKWAEHQRYKRMGRWSIFWFTKIRGQTLHFEDDYSMPLRTKQKIDEIYFSYQKPFHWKMFLRQMKYQWFGR